MSTPFPFRFVEVRGVRYLRLDDVAAFLHALGSTEETDVRNRLDEAARLLKLSATTQHDNTTAQKEP